MEVAPATPAVEVQEGKRKKKSSRWTPPQPKASDLGVKKGDIIQLQDTEGWYDTTVVSRNIKAARRGKEVFNLKAPDGITRSVDLGVCSWRRPIDEERGVLLERGEEHEVLVQAIPHSRHCEPSVVAAKEKELNTLRQFGTFEEVKKSSLTADELAQMIPTTWAVVLKDSNNPDSVKARLCARGDKEKGFVRSDSPTVTRQALRLLLTIAATHKWKIKSLDFTGAFLQGQDIDRTVYLRPPADIRENNPDVVWKTIKRLYGFRDSGRGWWLEFEKSMKQLGCEATMIDPAMFVYKLDGEVVGLAGVHVDDVLFCGEPTFHDRVIDKLIKNYVIGRVEVENFTFTGWTLRQTDSGIELTQSHFLEQVELEKFDTFRQIQGEPQEQLVEKLQGLFRSIVGSIQWLVQVSRPDKCYQAVALSSKLGKANVTDAKLAYKVLKSMIDEPQTIMFPNMQDFEGAGLRVYTDSSWGRLNGFETVNGDITFLTNRAGQSCVLDWQSLKMATPAASPLAGEAEAALSGISKVPWLRSLASDMGIPHLKATLVTDSKSLCETVQSTTVTKDKRAMVAIANLRRAGDQDLEVLWDSASRQLADCLTKGGPQVKPQELREVLQVGKLQLTGQKDPARMRRGQGQRK